MSRKPRKPEAGESSGPAGGDDEAELRRAVRARAMSLLARREHSRRELARKLARGRGDQLDAGLVEAVVAELGMQELQSDRRFAEALARRRADMGYGPLRLLAELREHGLDAGDEAAAVVNATDAQWVGRAREARTRRFGDAPPASRRDLARQLRFLQYRGFTAEQARKALDGRDDDT